MTSASASRVTRSSRSLRRAALLFAGVLAGITALRAQEPRPAPQPASSASVPAVAPAKPVQSDADPAAATIEAAPDSGNAPAKASQPATSVPSPARFVPTEKVRADFDVSFPVDI